MQTDSYLQLADYRRQVFDNYARVRESKLPPETRWQHFRSDQDHLFKTHPQTALDPEQVAKFSGLRYYPYNPAYRFILPIEPLVNLPDVRINLQVDGPIRLLPIGRISFELSGDVFALTIYWFLGYGGGLFLPFKDLTNAADTFAGGRYILDTIKGADLGREGDHLVIDFNFAYNPSCAYNSRWQCPLPPPENQLPIPIPVGEMRFI
jgi:uncharacterized protein (DUF1684 family)